MIEEAVPPRDITGKVNTGAPIILTGEPKATQPVRER